MTPLARKMLKCKLQTLSKCGVEINITRCKDYKNTFAQIEFVNEQCVVYNFQCDLCDAGYVGYTCGHLHNHVKGHKQQSSAIAKHYKNVHGMIPQDLLKHFEVLKVTVQFETEGKGQNEIVSHMDRSEVKL